MDDATALLLECKDACPTAAELSLPDLARGLTSMLDPFVNIDMVRWLEGGTNVREKKLTISVPEAAALLGIKSKDAAYAAARAGTIPTIRFGRLLRVPVAAMERLLQTSIASAPVPKETAAKKKNIERKNLEMTSDVRLRLPPRLSEYVRQSLIEKLRRDGEL